MPWHPEPDKPIGAQEAIARRIYDEPMLVGAADQGPFPGIEMRHFEDTRDRELSVDRCGSTGVENAVIRYLRPRAIEMGKAFRKPKEFNGWLYVHARELIKPAKGPQFQILPSPRSGEELDENKYHAHIPFPGGVESYDVALRLREIYAKRGIHIKHSPQTEGHRAPKPLGETPT